MVGNSIEIEKSRVGLTPLWHSMISRCKGDCVQLVLATVAQKVITNTVITVDPRCNDYTMIFSDQIATDDCMWLLTHIPELYIQGKGGIINRF